MGYPHHKKLIFKGLQYFLSTGSLKSIIPSLQIPEDPDFICSKATQMLSFELNLTLFSLSLDFLFAPFSRCIDKLQVYRQ